MVGVGANKSFHTPDGQYLSWANSWSEVYDSGGGGKAGNGAYLNRPNGLLTRPDLALLVGALNSACGSANSLEEVFGPTIVYNRPSLDRLMRESPDENVNEWVDEQAGMLMKFGVPILQVTRIEDLRGRSESSSDGLVLQIPDASTDPSTVSTITKLVAAGTAVLLSGRADKIHPELLKLAGAEVATGTFGNSQVARRLAPPYPASRVNASLIRQAGWESAASLQTLSLSPRVGVRATAEGKVFATVDDGGKDSAVLVASSTNKAYWVQLNDLGGPEDVSLAGFGTAGLYHATASLLNEASQTVVVASGINATHPAAVHAWRSGGTIKVLLPISLGIYSRIHVFTDVVNIECKLVLHRCWLVTSKVLTVRAVRSLVKALATRRAVPSQSSPREASLAGHLSHWRSHLHHREWGSALTTAGAQRARIHGPCGAWTA